MNDDFNPFDLSAVPQAATEQKPATPTPPKPIIRRISMGPIFHSRITKILAAILSIVLAVLIGYTATSYYLTHYKTALLIHGTTQA